MTTERNNGKEQRIKKLKSENVGNTVTGIIMSNDVASKCIRVGNIEIDKSYTRKATEKGNEDTESKQRVQCTLLLIGD